MQKQLIVTGGIGNQMFEYAFFLACKTKKIDIILNTDMYQVHQMHNGFMLSEAFNIPDEHVKSTTKLSALATRLLCRYPPLNLVYKDENFVYSEEAFLTHCLYLNGVFISEHYFFDIADKIRKVFSFSEIDIKNSEIATAMTSSNSVSLHIRRGDYLDNPIYCVCNDAYYTNAINYIKKHVKSPLFYVFSDDPIWCKDFLVKFDIDFQIIDHNQGRACYKDMFLMTQCKHNIIANSTFSWWGAWLNSNSEKIVIAPKSWFSHKTVNINCRDWISI